MNTELKALLKLIIDGFAAGKDALAKQNFATKVFPDLFLVCEDVPAVISNWPDLKAEIAALGGAEADADLVSYVLANVPGVTTDAHAKAVVGAALDLAANAAEKSIALIAAIKAPAPASA